MRVFLKESVVVPRPLEAIWGRFVGDSDWFARFATEAEEDSEALYFQVGPSWAGRQMTRRVRVTLGPPYNRGTAIVVPLSWEASSLPGLFPVLDGEMEVASIDTEHCRLTLSASYTPPLGEVGRQLNQLLLHGVASSTARAFLDRVADGLEASPRGSGL
ncbi:MAG: SRPBCC family protein [Acidimicrobiales bacterium]